MEFTHLLPLLRLLILPLAGFGAAPPSRVPLTAEEPTCRVWIEPRTYRPGDVLVALGRCDAPPTAIRGRFGANAVIFFPMAESETRSEADASGDEAERLEGETQLRAFGALLGIDVEASPGTIDLAWEASFAGGEASGVEPVRVEGRDFPSQRLRLPRRFVQPDSAALERIRIERERLTSILATRSPERLWREAFRSPLPAVPGSGFGARRILNGVPSSPHTGLDLPAPTGEPVHASNAGRVMLADTLYYAGRTIVLDHGLGLYTIYSHLSQASALPGDLVERGQPIGRVGATGRVTGAHLHWAAQVSRARVDPLSLLSATAGVIDDAARLPSPTALPGPLR